MDEAYEKVCYLYRRWLKKTKEETPPKDVEDWFEEFTENGRMTETKLREFLMKYQGEDKERASQLARKATSRSTQRSQTFLKKPGLSRKGFLKYLLSRELNPPLALKGRDDDDDDMKDTLPHYFVYASHHPYMKGEQDMQTHFMPHAMASDDAVIPATTSEEDHYKISSSVTAIAKALSRGVRVIELHLHPNSLNTDVYVHHKGPSYSSVTLKRCLDAIKDHAFKTSHFPVIIVLVESLSLDLQANAARKIEKKLGNQVCSTDAAFTKPLNSLKNQFIILSRQPKQEPPTANRDVHEEYKKLIAADIKGLGSELLNLRTVDSNKVEVFSSTESLLENAKGGAITRITQKNLLAVYRDPSRQDEENFSSNYDPFIGWTHGAQMVALDMHDNDKYLWIMQGLFRAYGGSGYVRKPSTLLNEEQIFDPTAWRPVKKILKVKVYMGTGWHLDFDNKDFDPTSPPDFFAAIEILGVPADEAREKTIPVMDKWIPTWNQEFEFPLTVPELAVLMIEVREFDPDRTHDFGGQTCLPVLLLRNGIRSVPLYNEKGKPYISARLLIHFQLY